MECSGRQGSRRFCPSRQAERATAGPIRRAVKDLRELGEAVAGGNGGERGRLERTVENIDFLQKHAPLRGDRQVLAST